MLEAANKQKKISDSVEPNNSISHDDDEPQQQQQPRRQGQSATVTSPSANPPSSVVVVVDGSCSSSNSKFDLAHFEPVRILNNNSTHKTVSLLGHFGNLSRDKFAIIVLEKTAFTEAQLRNSSCREVTTAATDGDEKSSTTSSESESNKSSTTIAEEAAGESSYFSAKSHLRTEFVNDIYGNFLCVTDPEVNQLKVTIIYPASEKHISKYSAHARYLVEETVDDYRTVTLPHLEQEQLSLEWLYNILEHRKEKDRIIYEDPSEETGFILLPDLKHDPPGIHCEKSHLLTTIIENLELVPDYYQKVTLSCVLSEVDKLYAKLKAAKKKADEQPEAKRAKIE